MTMRLYTLMHDGRKEPARHLSAEDVAEIVLTADGYAYDIVRLDDDGRVDEDADGAGRYVLRRSMMSRNSGAGDPGSRNNPMQRVWTVRPVAAASADDAWSGLAAGVAADARDWRGFHGLVMRDEEYDRDLAEDAAE
jgi:hypothetical protein